MSAADKIPSTGNPYVEGVRLFVRAVQFLDSLPFPKASPNFPAPTIRDLQQQESFPGDPDRRGPSIAQVPPFIPAPSFPPGTPGRPRAPAPGRIPGRPGGPSIPDRVGGRVAVPGIPAILSRVIGWGFGLLTYPREAGRGSDLCVKTEAGIWCEPVVANVPAPAIPRGPRRRGRVRPGAAAPQTGDRARARARGRPQAQAQPQGRGRPVVISQPRPIPAEAVREAVRAIPPAQLPIPTTPPVTAPLPRSAVQARPVSLPRTLPRAIPATAAIVGPVLGSWVFGSPSTGMPNIRTPMTNPLTLPGQFPSPGPSPLRALNPAGLTALRAAPATSAAQDLDRQCRERAKERRKRKKRKPRSVCYRGTFKELKNGTRKYRKEKIPCQ